MGEEEGMTAESILNEVEDLLTHGKRNLALQVIIEGLVIRFEDGKAAAGWKGPRIGGTK